MELKKEQYQLEMVDISGSTFTKVMAEKVSFDNVNLAGTMFNNINMSEVSINDVNLSGAKITGANISGGGIKDADMSHFVFEHIHLFGAEFHNVVLPQEGGDNYSPTSDYKAILFNNCKLNNSLVESCDLSNMVISDCNITGLRINGYLIEDLINNSRQ
jgi:uncharacterized protein YjbI with pentapeptide repeats